MACLLANGTNSCLTRITLIVFGTRPHGVQKEVEQPFPRHAPRSGFSLVRLLQRFDNVRQNGSFWHLKFFATIAFGCAE
jgi:hypothetical protein